MADLTKDNGEYGNTTIRKPLLGKKTGESFFMCGNEFLTQPNPIKWLIKGVLQKGSLAMIHGPSGSGMTSVVLDWALHLAHGIEEWQGMKVRPCNVVYLNGEDFQGIYNGVAAWTIENPNYKLGNITFSEDWTDEDNQIQVSKVIKEIELTEKRPGLIVIDMLDHFYSIDGTVTKATRTFLKSCVALQQEFGCTILLVHTTSTNPNLQYFMQGYSNCKGMLDQEFGVTLHGKDGLTLTQIKLRDGEKKGPMRLKLKTINIPGWLDDDYDPVSSVVLEKVDRNTNQIKQQPNSIFESPICMRESEEDSNG